MNLGIDSQVFVVTGASSGLGRAVVDALAVENASLVLVARRADLLKEIERKYVGQITTIAGDVRDEEVHDQILNICEERGVHGIFVNAGGPPAKKIAETGIEDWDEAYKLLIRWKVQLVGRLMPVMQRRGYGRVLFSESSSLKQPVDNLVLSNSLRLAIAGYSKTLSKEYAEVGITANVIAPGFHDTDAVNRLFKKKSELENISIEEAKERTLKSIPVQKMGDPSDFATLAAWLLSPGSGFVTGQLFALDGGNIRSTF